MLVLLPPRRSLPKLECTSFYPLIRKQSAVSTQMAASGASYESVPTSDEVYDVDTTHAASPTLPQQERANPAVPANVSSASLEFDGDHGSDTSVDAMMTNRAPAYQECNPSSTVKTPENPPIRSTKHLDAVNNDDAPARQNNTSWRRVGVTNCLILGLGSLVILVVLTILILVWDKTIRAANGIQLDKPWSYLLEIDASTTLVTIRTALIRSVGTLQAGVLTAMLASLVLENIDSPIHHAPLLSILRAVGTNPASLIPAITFRPRHSWALSLQLLVFLEIVLLLALQFCSTILLSDFSDAHTLSTPTKIPVHTGQGITPSLSSFWAFPPTGFTFAEYATRNSTQSDALDDTGHTYRAFLPFTNEAQRTSLRRFRGQSLVTDNRVVCVSPVLAIIELRSELDGEILHGSLDLKSRDYSVLLEKGPQAPFNFSCVISHLFEQSLTTARRSGVYLCLDDVQRSWGGLLKNSLVRPPPPGSPSSIERMPLSPSARFLLSLCMKNAGLLIEI